MWKDSIRNIVVIFQPNILRIVGFYVRHSAHDFLILWGKKSLFSLCVEKSGAKMSLTQWFQKGHFHPKLFNPNLQWFIVGEFMVEQIMIQQFMVEKSVVQNPGFKIWGSKSGVQNSGLKHGFLKVRGWNFLQPK